MSDDIASKDALPRGTVLRGYSIREVLGQGGFGIVYRARHIELGNVVAIKEYLPAELAVRVGSSVRPRSAAYVDFYQDGLRRFRKEGQALVALHNQSGIVSCRDFFRRNNTAYLVMEFEAGMPLSEVLRVRESEGRPFSEKDMMDLAIPLLEGLRHVHAAGMVHRDIKPSNLLLREANGEPVLIDFGAAKHDAATQTKSMAPRTPGYAAWEQIVPDGKLGPWTDIYAIGVLLWRIVAGGTLTGERRYPVPVEGRMDAILRGEPDPMPSAIALGRGRFNIDMLVAIDKCLKLCHHTRVQDCSQLLGLLGFEAYSQYGTVAYTLVDVEWEKRRKLSWARWRLDGLPLAQAIEDPFAYRHTRVTRALDGLTLAQAIEHARAIIRAANPRAGKYEFAIECDDTLGPNVGNALDGRAGKYEFAIECDIGEVHRETLEIGWSARYSRIVEARERSE